MQGSHRPGAPLAWAPKAQLSPAPRQKQFKRPQGWGKGSDSVRLPRGYGRRVVEPLPKVNHSSSASGHAHLSLVACSELRGAATWDVSQRPGGNDMAEATGPRVPGLGVLLGQSPEQTSGPSYFWTASSRVMMLASPGAL